MDIYRAIIDNSPVGYAYHKIILAGNHGPYDYEFIEMNTAFENFTGLKRANILGKRVSELKVDFLENDIDWIDFYADFSLKIIEKEMVFFFFVVKKMVQSECEFTSK